MRLYVIAQKSEWFSPLAFALLRQHKRTVPLCSSLVETMHRIVPTFRTAEEVNAEAIANLDYSNVHAK